MSETAKHTPGPWESWPHNRPPHPREYSHGVSAEGEAPCDVADVIAFDGEPGESEANARLIAAAPDLLEACLQATAILAAAAVALKTLLAPAAPELVAKMAADFRAVEAQCDAALAKTEAAQ